MRVIQSFPPQTDETMSLVRDDFDRLGLPVNEFRAPVIRRAASRNAKTIAGKFEHSADDQSIAQLTDLSLATYRLLDPRRRVNDRARAHIGRILPQTLSASNPIRLIGKPPSPQTDDSQPFGRTTKPERAPADQDVFFDQPHWRFEVSDVGDSLDDRTLLRQTRWSRTWRQFIGGFYTSSLAMWGGVVAVVFLGLVVAKWSIAHLPAAAKSGQFVSSINDTGSPTRLAESSAIAPNRSAVPSTVDESAALNEPASTDKPGPTHTPALVDEPIVTDQPRPVASPMPEQTPETVTASINFDLVGSSVSEPLDMTPKRTPPNGFDAEPVDRGLPNMTSGDQVPTGTDEMGALTTVLPSDISVAELSGFLDDPFAELSMIETADPPFPVAASNPASFDEPSSLAIGDNDVGGEPFNSMQTVEDARRVMDHWRPHVADENDPLHDLAVRQTSVAMCWIESPSVVESKLREWFGGDASDAVNQAFMIANQKAVLPEVQRHLLNHRRQWEQITHRSGFHESIHDACIRWIDWASTLEPQSVPQIHRMAASAQRFTELSDRAATLETTVQDGDAVSARYWAFVRSRWQDCLAALQQSSNQRIAAAAAAERRLRQTSDLPQRQEVATRWQSLADGFDDPYEANQVRQHADEILVVH